MVTPVYTKEEAATLLKVDKRTIDRFIMRGQLECFKMGRKRMFTEDNLNDFIKNGGKIS